jgi:hypothetical protein
MARRGCSSVLTPDLFEIEFNGAGRWLTYFHLKPDSNVLTLGSDGEMKCRNPLSWGQWPSHLRLQSQRRRSPRDCMTKAEAVRCASATSNSTMLRPASGRRDRAAPRPIAASAGRITIPRPGYICRTTMSGISAHNRLPVKAKKERLRPLFFRCSTLPSATIAWCRKPPHSLPAGRPKRAVVSHCMQHWTFDQDKNHPSRDRTDDKAEQYR